MKLSAMHLIAMLACSWAAAPVSQAADNFQDTTRSVVDQVVQPLMAKDHIAGMAVGIVVGDQHFVFNYGQASRHPQKPVTDETLFELGSVSKTLTATLTSYAQVKGYLALSDSTSKYLPFLRNTPFGKVSLLNLGTHTPGGLPLQVPDDIHNNDQLLAYFRAWQPRYAAGTYRTYANPGIGTLGWITATSMHQDFARLMEHTLFPALGMTHSYVHVPAAKQADYAEGYTEEGVPIRMSGGVLSDEAYGVRTTATDMVRFIEANMRRLPLDPSFQRAVSETHTGYFQAGPMTQDLIWEQYPFPVSLKALLDGNSQAMIFNATPVTEIKPVEAPRDDVWINKTGSTNGFGAYVAFIPQQQLGIVMLANQAYPIDERVTAAYQILTALAHGGK